MREGSDKQFMSYRHHVIWFDTDNKVYKVALKRDRTDDVFSTWEEAMDAIDAVEKD